MECLHCKGTLKKGEAPIRIDRDGWHITINSAPAWVCDQCGEYLFDENEVAAIQDLIKTVEHGNALVKCSA